MKYKIHPANGGKCIAEKVIDLGFFFSVSKFCFQGDFTLLKFLYLFARTKGLNVVVLWGFFLRLFFDCSFIFVLICILNIRDQFSCVLFGFSFSLVFKPRVVTCVLLKRE